MPQPGQDVAYLDGPNKGQPTEAWWRFWYGLFTRSQADVPFLVGAALTGTGTTQADALVLADDWNEITTTPAASGVLLPSFGIGVPVSVWNAGANSLKVYPPIGLKINALAVNAPFVLAAGAFQTFAQLSATQIRTQF